MRCMATHGHATEVEHASHFLAFCATIYAQLLVLTLNRLWRTISTEALYPPSAFTLQPIRATHFETGLPLASHVSRRKWQTIRATAPSKRTNLEDGEPEARCYMNS